MSENFLTPAEIEALLGQAATSADAASMPRERGRESVSSEASPNGKTPDDTDSRPRHRHRETPADRKRRNRLWAIHEQAAHNVGVALSALLRTAVEVRLTDIDAIDCQSFTESIAAPTCIYSFRSPAAAGPWILEIPTAILIPMLDRLLGNNIGAIATAEPRPLSEIEQRLSMRLGACVAGEMNRAWASTIGLALSLERIECDPRWLSLGPPESEVFVASYDARLGKARGTLRFGIPPQAMDVLQRHLLPNSGTSIGGPQPTTFDHNPAPVDRVQLTVDLLSSPTTAEEVANLTIGDLIAVEHRIDSPAIVKLDGHPEFFGHLGAAGGRKAVRIENAIE
ncbi:MAG: FliM/FliN family flagellar motor switch protein [Pirellulales bacterium]|nr:FliM/FliN family flagellar motor switch protein [Pirellulales bacterium]